MAHDSFLFIKFTQYLDGAFLFRISQIYCLYLCVGRGRRKLNNFTMFRINIINLYWCIPKINIPENCDCSHLVITISLCKEEVVRAGCCSAAVSLSFKINWGFCANYFSCTALCFVPPSSLHLSSHCSVTPSSQMWAALAWGRRAHVDSNLASL